MFFAEDPNATSQQQLTEATANFFVTQRYQSPFHAALTPDKTFIDFDLYRLIVQEIRDELGNRRTVGARDIDPTKPLLQTWFSYMLIKPVLIMDANRNRSAVVFDEIGNVIATAVLGKPEEPVGNSVSRFVPISEAATLTFIQNPLPQNRAQILQNATSVTLIDIFAYYRTKTSTNPQPIVQCKLSRETHSSDGTTTRIQYQFAYVDRGERTIQQKVEAEPDESGSRWNCTG